MEIIVRFGEIFLKSPFVFDQMKRRLTSNIRSEIKKRKINANAYEKHDKILIETKNLKKIEEILFHTFGISSFSHAKKVDLKIGDIEREVKNIAEKWNKNSTFAIRTKRNNKSFRYTSREINVKLGRIITKMGFKVDLDNPDKEIFVKISNRVYIYSKKIKGPGGLPLKQSYLLCDLRKKEAVLATWLIMKRGLFPFFTKGSKKDLLQIIRKWAVGKELKLLDKKKKKYMKAIISSEADINKIKKLKEKNKMMKNRERKLILTPLVGLNKEYIKNKTKNLELSL